MNKGLILFGIGLALCWAPACLGQEGGDLGDDRGDIDPALTAWWKLDETSGSIATDATGNANDGKLRGDPVWVKGFKGAALELDGEDDYVAITNFRYAHKGLTETTVTAWIRTVSEAHQIVASFDRNEYWRLEVGNPVAGPGLMGWDLMTDLGQVDLFGRGRVDDGRWHHVAGVFNNGWVMIYIDGNIDATVAGGRSFGTGNTRFGFLGVGSEADVFDGLKGPESYVDGALDDVRIYNRALSQAEIKLLAFRGPSNDDCVNAEPVSEVIDLPFDTTRATFDGEGICMTSPNLWYLYTASCTGVATVSLCGSRYDTMLAVYAGAECWPGRARLLGCNDDFCGLQSQLTFDVIAGDAYLIEVGGFDQRTGEGVLTIACEAVTPVEYDLGDAPDGSNAHGKRMTAYTTGAIVLANFPTVFDDRDGRPRGPLHLQPLAVAHLGEAVSLEVEADRGPDEDGVNNIDPAVDQPDQDGADDGVLLPITLPHCEWASFDYLVNVIEPGTDLWVNVWLDFNRDGDWDDDSVTDPQMVCDDGTAISEWVVRNQYLFDLPKGLHQITAPAFLAWHPGKGPAEIWVRITLSERPWRGGNSPGIPGNGGSGPAEGYAIGETEDYRIIPEQADCALCKDLNGDGRIDFDDLIELMYLWLDCCLE
jgi:hypothetical protein